MKMTMLNQRVSAISICSTLIFTSLFLFGCGQQSDESFSETKYLLIDDEQAGLTKHVYDLSIEICIEGDSSYDVKFEIEQAILEWLSPMYLIDSRVTTTVEFRCPGHALVFLDEDIIRDHTILGDYPQIMLNPSSYYFRYSTLHEMGHAFGLEDTYVESVFNCKVDQPTSVMCAMDTTFLQPDDWDGAQAIFRRTWGIKDY